MFERSPTLENVVRRAIQGEREARARLVECFHQRLFRFVFFRVGGGTDAEDLTQDIWVKVFRKLPGLRDPAQFGTWLFRIARNQITDHFRRQAVRRILGQGDREEEDVQSFEERLPSPDPDGLDEMLRKDFWKRLKALLDTLSKREREVFILRYLDQLPIKEISRILGTSESSVKTYLCRGLKKVRSSPLLLSLEDQSDVQGKTLRAFE